MKYTALLLTALLALPACSARHSAVPAEVESVTCGSIKTIHAVDDLYLAGQPSAEDYALLKARGIKTVIDLRHATENRGYDEAHAVNQLGMRYVPLPWNGADELTDETLDKMRQLLREAERPLLMKCGSSNRVGAGWLAYRVLDEGVEIDRALAEAKAVGMRSKAYETKTIAYINAQ